MAKPKQPLGRKVTMSQPVAIPFDRYIALVEGKVIKGPVVPKMEQMEKWIVSGGRDIEVHKDREAGIVLATLTCPGPNGPAHFFGEGKTIPLAVMEAIHDYLVHQPKPDPAGSDLPLFRGNGGTATVVEQQLLDDPSKVSATAPDPAGWSDVPFSGETIQLGEPGFDTGDLPPDEDDGSGWQFLCIVPDQALWKADPPRDELAPIVEFDEGKDDADRGWYLAPGYAYDHKAGEIRELMDGGETQVVWSRDAKAKPGVIAADVVDLVAAGAGN